MGCSPGASLHQDHSRAAGRRRRGPAGWGTSSGTPPAAARPQAGDGRGRPRRPAQLGQRRRSSGPGSTCTRRATSRWPRPRPCCQRCRATGWPRSCPSCSPPGCAGARPWRCVGSTSTCPVLGCGSAAPSAGPRRAGSPQARPRRSSARGTSRSTGRRRMRSGAQRAVQVAERLAASAWTDSGLVFTSEVGTAWEPKHALDRLKRLASSAGVQGCTLHTLRHTCATHSIDSGVHLKELQLLLAHSQQRSPATRTATSRRRACTRRCRCTTSRAGPELLSSRTVEQRDRTVEQNC